MRIYSKTLFSFFILGLTFLLLVPNAVAYGEYQTMPLADEGTILQTSNLFSANSNIGDFIPKGWIIEKPPWWDISRWGVWPEMVRYTLKDPEGNIKYIAEYKTDLTKETDSSWTVMFPDCDVRIPCFPHNGDWKLEVYCFSYFIGIEDFPGWGIAYVFTVGESGIWDNLMAPIYIYTDMFGWLASGDEFALALPGIFWLSALIWIPIVFIIFMLYIRSSMGIGIHLLRRKVGGKRNVKNEKNE